MEIWYKYIAISNKNSLETDDINYEFFYTLKDDTAYFVQLVV